jgi:antitoxin FitA
MASITIRRIEEDIKARLRVRAAQHGRSMEEEAREILRAGLTAQSVRNGNLADAIRRHIEPLGGVVLEIPPREAVRTPPNFEE